MEQVIDEYARQSDDVEEELLSRKRARIKLINFSTYTYKNYTIDPLQIVLADKLEGVLRNDIKRLMVFAPPQHGKSELVSVRFPAYWLAKRPDDPIILCSYGAELAYDKVMMVRQLITGMQFKALFPKISINKLTRAGVNWRIKDHQGIMYATGVGGPITGHGAQLGIIDDPLKNYQEAESITMRDKVWKWYTTTFRTRIWENGAIIIVMTRWHEDDLAGRLLNQQQEKWEVIRLPAVAETQEVRDKNSIYLGLTSHIGKPDPAGRRPGEALCPHRFSLDTLAALKTDVGSVGWTAQYCGTPRMPEGNLIKTAWFKEISLDEVMELIPHMTLVRYWDKAATEGGGGGRTAGVLIGRDNLRRYYIIDVVKGRWSTYNRERIMKDTAERDSLAFSNKVQIWVELEPGSGGQDSARATIANLDGYSVHSDRPSSSKLTRLQPFMSQAEAGNVRMVKGGWNWDWLEELTAVPTGNYMDQVDATSGAFNKLAITGWARGPVKK